MRGAEKHGKSAPVLGVGLFTPPYHLKPTPNMRRQTRPRTRTDKNGSDISLSDLSERVGAENSQSRTAEVGEIGAEHPSSNSRRQTGSTGTGPGGGSGPPQDQPTTVKCFQCHLCEKSFETYIGVRLHQKRSHPKEFRDEFIAATQTMKGKVWDEAYKHMFAEAEAQLVMQGVTKPGAIVEQLAKIFTELTTTQIRYRRRNIHNHPDRVNRIVEAFKQNEQIENQVTHHESSSGVTEISQDEIQTQQEGGNIIEKEFKGYFESSLEPDEELRDLRSNIGITKDIETIDRYVQRWLKRVMGFEVPNIQVPKHHTSKPVPPARNGPQRKRRLVQATQEAFERNKSRCISEILNGTFGTSHSVDQAELNNFWNELFTKEPPPCNMEVRDIKPVEESLGKIITETEIKEALKKIKTNTAKGLDKIDPASLKKVDAKELQTLFNVFLSTSHTPSWMRRGRVTLVPKKPSPTKSSEFRPITVTSILLRTYHGVIAQRLDTIQISKRQKGFQKQDGILENSWILKQLIKLAKKQHRTLNLVFIDVAKAFDSLTHEAIERCLTRAGVPEGLRAYLRELYADAKLLIGTNTDYIRQTCGILQGDPLSGYIFNIALDWAYDGLDPELGFKVGERTITNMLFADDGILLTGSKRAAQQQMSRLEERLGQIGLKLNPAKCATLHLAANKKKKKSLVDNSAFLRIHGEMVPALEIGESYKYLGLQAGDSGYEVDLTAKLNNQIKRITASKLRPQQRMEALRNHIIPGMYHQLVLGHYTLGKLKALDVKVREAVRKWTHLPKDTPKAFFHANIRDGGMGVPALETCVPCLAWKRLRKVLTSQDEIMKELNNVPEVRGELRRVEQHCSRKGRVLDSREQISAFWRSGLLGTVDGRALRGINETPAASLWASTTDIKMSGEEFVKGMRTRAGVLPTPARKSRASGREARSNPLCVRDNQRATMNHISQVCQTTHGLRVKRHNIVVDMVTRSLRRAGWKTWVEKRIPRSGSYLKPDIIATRGDQYIIWDPIICGDNQDLEVTAATKVAIYNVEEVHVEAARLVTEGEDWTGARVTGSVEGLAFNTRGAISVSSLRALRQAGMTPMYITLICLRVLVLTHKIISAFNNATG